MLELAKQYAALQGAAILTHRIEGKEITFVLSTGPKLTLTESQLQLAIRNLKGKAGTVADGETTPPPASSESASRAPSKTKKKEGN